MPRRNEKLTAKQAYWIKRPSGKGYTVHTEEFLQKLLSEGRIGENDLVQKRTIL